MIVLLNYSLFILSKEQDMHFHQLGPLGRVGPVVAKSVCVLCVYPLPMRFSPPRFQDLSLDLWSHDQFKASHWSTLPPPDLFCYLDL